MINTRILPCSHYGGDKELCFQTIMRFMTLYYFTLYYSYDMLLKLLMDFYGDEMVAQAKSVLLENVIVPDDDDAKRSRKGINKKLNSMKDILNVFLVLTLEQLPLFVVEDLANLPPLSMDNFDMSSVIKDMENITNQMGFLQEAQETSLSVHAALCKDKSRDGTAQPMENTIVLSPAPSTGATPERSIPHTYWVSTSIITCH